jgi:hypothetical protein
MAEIIVEKRKPVWPWFLAAFVVVFFLIYFLAFQSDNNEVTAGGVDTAVNLIEVKENNNTINSFVTFIRSDDNRMSLDHQFTNSALYRLIESVESIAEIVEYDIQADLEKVREYADNITVDPFVDTHADDIRRAADVLTTVLQNIQQAKYPELSSGTDNLKSAAESIDPDILTLDQRDKVKGFLAEAANLLDEMN